MNAQKFFRNIKNILVRNNLFSQIIVLIYILYNRCFLKNNISIYKDNQNWIHKTSIGLIPSNRPIFKPEDYVKQNFEIFFEKYLPKEKDVVIEFGSGIGCETLYISKKIGKNGKIYAVEPFVKVFNYLQETINLNHLINVKPINKALYKDSFGAGFESDLDHWLGGKIKIVSQNKVPTIDLDMLVKTENINQIDFCKINVEGAEKYITYNSDLFFDLCKNIVIECHDFMQENEYKTFELVKKFLKQKGYVVSFSKRNKYPWDKYYVYAQK